jgi:hypothetical protein
MITIRHALPSLLSVPTLVTEFRKLTLHQLDTRVAMLMHNHPSCIQSVHARIAPGALAALWFAARNLAARAPDHQLFYRLGFVSTCGALFPPIIHCTQSRGSLAISVIYAFPRIGVDGRTSELGALCELSASGPGTIRMSASNSEPAF